MLHCVNFQYHGNELKLREYGSIGTVTTDDGNVRVQEQTTSDIPPEGNQKRYFILLVIGIITFLGKAERSIMAPFYPNYVSFLAQILAI